VPDGDADLRSVMRDYVYANGVDCHVRRLTLLSPLTSN